MAYPTTLDSFVNPSPTDKRDNPSVANTVTSIQVAVEALEAKVGVNTSAVATSLDYLVTNALSIDPGHSHTELSGVTIGGTDSGDIVDTDSAQTLTNKTIAGVSPTGSITMFAGSSAPTGWLICDGSAVSRTTYADLFSVIGTTYGAGDGSTTFAIPNVKGKTPVGYNSADTDFDALGETGGAKTHTLTSAEMPTHLHTVNPPSTSTSSNGAHTHSNYRVSVFSPGAGTGLNDAASGTPVTAMSSEGAHTHTVDIAQFNSGNAGSGNAHSIMQPYIVFNYIIKT